MHVIALLDDLIFLSRIRSAAAATGTRVVRLGDGAALVDTCRRERPALVLADLDAERVGAADALAALRAEADLGDVPAIGFFSHVREDRAEAARAAGFDRVLARGAFVRELPELLERASAERC